MRRINFPKFFFKLHYCFFIILFSSPASAVTVVGTETVLNKMFGVNIHMDNCCGNYSNVNEVISQLKYIGARRIRDWATNYDLISRWRAINSATGVRFHASIPQASPINQRLALERIKLWLKTYPGLIDVIEGTNEPDTPFPISLGATLEDSAQLQSEVYKAGVDAGVTVAQLSVGAGWIPPLYEGNYMNFGHPPAHYGNAHVYMNPGVPPSSALKRIGDLAAYSVNGGTVDSTEFGAFKSAQSEELTGAYIHQAPFSAYLLGHAGLFVYALHDNSTNVISFYDINGVKRPFADYWHYTTQLLSDPNGKNLPPKEMDITFLNQKSTGTGLLGIKNVVMYKADGTLWIAMFDEEKPGAANASQTIKLDKSYGLAKLFDGRTGAVVRGYQNINSLSVTMEPNHVYLLALR
jgi:hypothetical protein